MHEVQAEISRDVTLWITHAPVFCVIMIYDFAHDENGDASLFHLSHILLRILKLSKCPEEPLQSQ